ncbi:MAG TPA: hypothetical protein VEH86_02635 [Candidatus Acidoferrum sp.]|nr:hypothetical protein [Candidatus Acidoferrum sp.]
MSEERVVRRSVANILGLLCVILAVVVAGVLAYYTTTINGKNFQISSLNSQVTNQQDQIGDLTSILNLNNSTIWVNGENVSSPANGYAVWSSTGIVIPYAGYVSVQVDSYSASLNNYVQMVWTSHELAFDYKEGFSNNGTMVFPILSTPNLEIDIGTVDHSTATFNVTITYYY